MWCYDTVARKWLHPQFSNLSIVWSNQPVESFKGFFRPHDGQMFLYDGYAQLARYLPTNGSQPWGPWGQVNAASGLVLPIVTKHTFTLTSNGLAVLLGGLQPNYQTLSFQTLYIFDTHALTWSLKVRLIDLFSYYEKVVEECSVCRLRVWQMTGETFSTLVLIIFSFRL